MASGNQSESGTVNRPRRRVDGAGVCADSVVAAMALDVTGVISWRVDNRSGTHAFVAFVACRVVASGHLNLELVALGGLHTCSHLRHVDGDTSGTIGIRQRC